MNPAVQDSWSPRPSSVDPLIVPYRAPVGGGWQRGLWAAGVLLLLMCSLGGWHRSGLTEATVRPQPSILAPFLTHVATTAAVTGATLSPSVAQAALPFDLTPPDPAALLQNFPAGLPQLPQAPALDFLKGTEEWPYSRFIRAVQTNQVARVVVNPEANRAEFTTRDGVTGTVTLLNSPELFPLLASHRVEVLVANSAGGAAPAWLGPVAVALVVAGLAACLSSDDDVSKIALVDTIDELIEKLEQPRRVKGKEPVQDKDEPASSTEVVIQWLKKRRKEVMEEVKEVDPEALAKGREMYQQLSGMFQKTTEKSEAPKDNAKAEPSQAKSDVPPGLPEVLRNLQEDKQETDMRKEPKATPSASAAKAKAKEGKAKPDSDTDSDSDSDEEGLLGLLRKLDRVVKEEEDEVASLAKPPAKLQVVPKTGVTFGDVAGAEEAKARLQEVVDFLKAPDKYTQFGARIPRGVLLTGSPGTGKTLLAKAVAGEAGVPFISVSGSEFVEVYGGLGAARVRNLFKLANANTPCIVFIDEIDGVGRARGTGLGQTNDEKEQTLNQLLVGMDGFQPNSGIVILGATNRPDILDPALTRAGRFDRQIVVELPDLRARRAILQVHTRTKPVAAAVSLDALAQQTPGLSGADLANVMNEAAILAARRDRLSIGPEEVEDALDRVVAGMAGNPLKTGKAKELIAYHEVGHAICSTLTPGHDPVKKVTLIPRGQAQGLTWFTPTDELNLLTRQQVFAAIVGALGGRAAEEVVYGRMETTSGAAGDLQQVTRLARAMVMQFGFSDLGPWNLSERGDSSQDVILRLMARERMSEKLAADIDRRVRSIVAEAYNVAKTQLITHREALDVLAAQLLEAETLSGEDLRATLSRYATIPEDHLQAVQALQQEPLLPTRAVS